METQSGLYNSPLLHIIFTTILLGWLEIQELDLSLPDLNLSNR